MRVGPEIKISVVLSFFNEENVIPELLSRMRAVFAKLIAEKKIGSYELIFVNDYWFCFVVL